MTIRIKSNPLSAHHTRAKVHAVTGAIPALLIDPVLAQAQATIRDATREMVPLHILAEVRDGQSPISAPPMAFELLGGAK